MVLQRADERINVCPRKLCAPEICSKRVRQSLLVIVWQVTFGTPMSTIHTHIVIYPSGHPSSTKVKDFLETAGMVYPLFGLDILEGVVDGGCPNHFLTLGVRNLHLGSSYGLKHLSIQGATVTDINPLIACVALDHIDLPVGSNSADLAPLASRCPQTRTGSAERGRLSCRRPPR